MCEEGSLDPDLVADSADSEGRARARAAIAYHHAFEDLCAGASALSDSNAHSHRVAGGEIVDSGIGFQLYQF